MLGQRFKAKEKTTWKSQSNADEQQGASEPQFRVMECLTEPLASTANTDQMFLHNSANIDMQGNNETPFLLAGVDV